MNNTQRIHAVFNKLQAHYGHFEWWHQDKPYEVMLGAILVQNTKWGNAQKALDNISAHIGQAVYPNSVAAMQESQLATLIRPSGYYNQKAKKLQALTQWFKRYDYNIQAVREIDKKILRSELLTINGIGAETADAILYQSK